LGRAGDSHGYLNGNDPGAGELKRMFPSLEESTVPAGWWIPDIGVSQGQCSGIASSFNQAWWMMSCSTEGYWYNPLAKYCVEGRAYIENTGGGGFTSEIPDDLYPAVYEKEWFKKRYGSSSNNTSSNRNTSIVPSLPPKSSNFTTPPADHRAVATCDKSMSTEGAG